MSESLSVHRPRVLLFGFAGATAKALRRSIPERYPVEEQFDEARFVRRLRRSDPSLCLLALPAAVRLLAELRRGRHSFVVVIKAGDPRLKDVQPYIKGFVYEQASEYELEVVLGLAARASSVWRRPSSSRDIRISEVVDKVQSWEIMNTLVKKTPAAVAMFDRDMVYLAASDRWYVDYGLQHETVLGKCHYDIFPEIRDRPDWMAIHQKVLSGATLRSDKECFVRSDGRKTWLRYELVPWYRTGGRVGGLIMFTEVISQQVEHEAQILQLTEQLKDQVKVQAQALETFKNGYKRRERRLTLLKNVADLANRSETMDEALRAFVQLIVQDFGLERGHAYQAVHAGSEVSIEPTGIICWAEGAKPDHKFDSPEFLASRAHDGFLQSFLSTVKTQQPRQSLIADVDFSRLAGDSGLTQRYLLPIFANSKLVAVLDFYSKQQSLNVQQRALLKQVAQHLGQVLGRLTVSQALRESEQRFADFLSHSQAFIYAKDLSGRLLFVSDSMLAALQCQTEDVIGQSSSSLDHQLANLFDAHDEQVLRDGVGIKSEDSFTFEGECRSYLTVKFPLRTTDNEIYAIAGVSSDITERVQLEEEAKAARKKAESASQAKSQFLAHMSHEIRTPMNAILGFAQLLNQPKIDHYKNREHVSAIIRAGDHLLGIINDVLEMSKIEAGHVALNTESFDLDQLLTDLQNMFKVRFEERSLLFSIMRSKSAPRFLSTDAGKLRQVLVNLLGNALKFTETGGVVLRVTPSADQSRLYFEVEDSGPGMTESELEQIFQPFERGHGGRRRRPGTGLGLAICEQFVELLGGQLDVRSKLGQGTVFSFEISVQMADSSMLASSGERCSVTLDRIKEQYRVLVVDDQNPNCVILRELLEPLGFLVDIAHNGQEAYEYVQSNDVDLVLTDLAMPVMDGAEATQKIRALPGKEKLPILLVTAGFVEDRQKYLDMGCSGVVLKPYKFDDVVRAVAKSLGLKTSRTRIQRPPSTKLANKSFTELKSLPPTLRNELCEVLIDGNMTAFIERLEVLRPTVGDAVEYLVMLAENYKYRAIMDLFGYELAA